MAWATKNKIPDRKPAVSGKFYPSDPQELKQVVMDLFANAKPRIANNPRGIISPHAGYVFSGPVAASAYNQLDSNKHYENIFLIGTSHHTYLKGASVYPGGNYIMPFGKIPVNEKIAKKLIESYDFFTFSPEAHVNEHSLEVQLPFLYYKLKHPFKIIPIIIATYNIDTIKQIAEALEDYFNDKNLFVVSTDFSHYPTYDDAKNVDKRTADAIISGDPDKFLSVIDQNKQLGIHNLATSICGWSATLTLMYLAQTDNSLKFKPIHYQNSGDSIYGDHYQVVGYYAIVLDQEQKKDDTFQLSEKEKIQLLKLARHTLKSYIRQGEIPKYDSSQFTENLNQPLGAFVTLKKNGKLRGCIGRFMPSDPLWQIVQLMTIASATEDTRFTPVTEDELEDITIEISVLTPLKRIKSIDEVKVGKHGIYVRYGLNSGTLLPQVATENGWDREQFVGYCCKYKAGLDYDCWKYAELYVYEAIVFDEEELGLA